ncbi:unnamed protein product [Knipowitschia caucasica]
MSGLSARSSVFTFQSAVHSSWVLQSLNEQRLRDVLCDVTVLVQDHSFRAHASVLCACSHYFHSRLPGAGRQSPVITLPNEVTAEGFEPLLHFAYTSKLLFTKENIRAVHSCADFLGFHNLETSCFDFLLPKFYEPKQPPLQCCQKVLSKKTAALNLEIANNPPTPCQPSSLENDQRDSSQEGSQMSGKEDRLCLVNRDTPLTLDLSATGLCPMQCIQCADSSKADHPAQFCDRDTMPDMGNVCNQSELADCGLPKMNVRELRQDHIETASESITTESVEVLGGESANCDQCPFRPQTGHEADLSISTFDPSLSANLSETSVGDLNQDEGFEDRSSVEREVAEHLAKGFWSELCPQPYPQEPTEQAKASKAGDFHWLKQLDLTSSMGDCPFLRDMGEGEEPALNGSLSQSERSQGPSSGEDSDTDMDADADAEANRRRAAEIQLPFPVEHISSLSRSAFQQLLRQQHLTPEQQDFVHDVRRRSKNRMAAQRCRKRKLDGIQQLQSDIRALRGERERLLQERVQLEQSLKDTRHNLSSLNHMPVPSPSPVFPPTPPLGTPMQSCPALPAEHQTLYEKGHEGSSAPQECPISVSIFNSLDMDSF